MSDLLIGYDSTGRIINMTIGEIDDLQVAAFAGMGLETVVVQGRSEFVSPAMNYILNGEVTERPTSPVSRTGLTLLDVPAGSKLTINGVSYDAEGTVELEFPLPGTYSLRVECFPFLDFVDEVTV